MREKRKRILFVKRDDANAKFVTNDISLLRKQFDVDVDEVHLPKNFTMIFRFALLFFRYLVSIPKYDLVYTWFADYHSLLPVMLAKNFGKKSIICAGGYESTYIPEIEMGVFTDGSLKKKLRRFCTTYSLRNCSMILPVDNSLISNVNSYIYSDDPNREPLCDGIKNMIPGIATPFRTVRLAYDPEVFKRKSGSEKLRAVVSAGFITNEHEYKRKGFDKLVECANSMRDVKFILIGLNNEHLEKLKQTGPGNLELHGRVSYEELISLYSRAKVYAQLSLFEGMPSSVCEAMLCECIPVGSDVNGIPDIIGDTGFIVYEKSVDEILSALSLALDYPDTFGKQARERMIRMFPLGKREKELSEIVGSLIE